MRPLFHPSIEHVTVEGILHALSDPARLAIYARIFASDCAHNCTTFSDAAERPVPKSTLSQHIKVLREAGLIRGERRGNEMLVTSRCLEIQERFPGLIRSIIEAHEIQSSSTMSS